MKFGLFGGAKSSGEGSADSQSYGKFVDYVLQAEELGYQSLFVVEHHVTGVSQVALDLGSAADPNTPDTIVINATGADDVIQLVNDNGVVRVTGLAATVEITGFEATDRIVINGLQRVRPGGKVTPVMAAMELAPAASRQSGDRPANVQ